MFLDDINEGSYVFRPEYIFNSGFNQERFPRPPLRSPGLQRPVDELLGDACVFGILKRLDSIIKDLRKTNPDLTHGTPDLALLLGQVGLVLEGVGAGVVIVDEFEDEHLQDAGDVVVGEEFL